MPLRNILKNYSSPAYYHVYNRGAGGQRIFMDSVDKRKFLSLFERSLSDEFLADNPEEDLHTFSVELVAYCLMGNHFHLLFYQQDDPLEISRLMKSVSTSYAMYFNKRHKRQGHLFQSIFRASWISSDSYLLHISRYIHLNPQTWRTFYWSSLRHFLGTAQCDWVHPERILTMSGDQYRQFMEDYEDRAAVLKALKNELAL